jgi:dihydroxyacid dehydratase/phosphogluconate dehydratase
LHRKAVDERAIAEPEWIEGSAISMGSAMGGSTNCAMIE